MSNPCRHDPCKGSPQPAAAPGEIVIAAHSGIEPDFFLINSQAPAPCLLVRINTDFMFLLVGALGFEPRPGRVKACCATATPYSRCHLTFSPRRFAFRVLSCAPAFLNFALATSGLRGKAGRFRPIRSLLVAAWCRQVVTIHPLRIFNPSLIHLSYSGVAWHTYGDSNPGSLIENQMS